MHRSPEVCRCYLFISNSRGCIRSCIRVVKNSWKFKSLKAILWQTKYYHRKKAANHLSEVSSILVVLRLLVVVIFLLCIKWLYCHCARISKFPMAQKKITWVLWIVAKQIVVGQIFCPATSLLPKIAWPSYITNLLKNIAVYSLHTCVTALCQFVLTAPRLTAGKMFQYITVLNEAKLFLLLHSFF